MTREPRLAEIFDADEERPEADGDDAAAGEPDLEQKLHGARLRHLRERMPSLDAATLVTQYAKGVVISHTARVSRQSSY